MKTLPLIVLAIALAGVEVVVSEWWLHLIVVAAIFAVLVPVGIEFARKES